MEEIQIIMAEGGVRPKVSGTAYGGDRMRLAGWQHPVVVDLSGMAIPESVPLLANHENRTSSRIGMVRAAVRNGTLEIDGEILSEGDDAKDIIAQGKSGADWQLSIGAEVLEQELVRGERTVNGQAFTGPFHHVKRSELREISVVAVGADGSTRMSVKAGFSLAPAPPPSEEKMETIENEQVTAASEAPESGIPVNKNNEEKENNMSENMKEEAIVSGSVPEVKARNEEVPEIRENAVEIKASADINAVAQEAADAAIKAERARVHEIQLICNGECPEIEKQAVSAGWSPEETTRNVLAAIRANRPASGVGVVVKSKPEGPELRKKLEAAMGLRAGVDAESLVKDCGEQAVEAGMNEMDMPLKQFVVECLRADGIEAGRGFGNETIRAAFSSVSLPGILSNVANKKLLQSYTAQPIIATKLCTTGDLSDFKENDRFRLTDVGDLLPIAADGEIKEGGLVEESAKNQLDTYGKKFCLTRKMIINDDLNAFMKVPAAMGNRAARLIDQLFFKRLLSNPHQNDGNPLFCASHKNFYNGSVSALSADSLKYAIRLFLDQVDADGQPISIEPRYLLVPTALKHLAIELTKGATLIMSGGSDHKIRPALNVLADENLRIVSSPYLGNDKYPGSSSTAWYLFGDPQEVDTWEIGFLKGKRTPTIEQGETDFNTLGMWFRVYFDIGVREQDHRGMVKANGAA